MNLRKTLAALILGFAAVGIASQSQSDAADQNAKVKKKAAKAKQKGKQRADIVGRPPVEPDSKPAPKDIKTPAAPARPTSTGALARLIDEAIDAKLSAANIQPSPEASDAEFMRRVYLDITGVIPSAEKATAFLDDRSPNKRARLIDELLEDPHYGRQMADGWANLMYLVDSDNRFIKKAPLHEWLTEKFNQNMHWDTMAYELITATGELDKNRRDRLHDVQSWRRQDDR